MVPDVYSWVSECISRDWMQLLVQIRYVVCSQVNSVSNLPFLSTEPIKLFSSSNAGFHYRDKLSSFYLH